MRIYSALLVFLVLLLASCVSTSPVANVTETPTVSKVEPVAPVVVAPRTKVVTFYRLSGREIAYPDGMLSGLVRNTYDDKGRVLKEEQLNGNKLLVSQKLYSYKDDGKVESQALNETGKVIGKSVQEYSGERLTKESSLSPEGVLQTLEEYTYDADGNQIKRTVRTANGNQTSSEYSWESGNKIKTVVKDGTGAIIKSYKMSYNAEGKLLGEEEYSPSGALLSKMVYIYDKGFLVRTENQNAQGMVQSANNFTNDAKGNPVKITSFDRRGREFEILNQTWREFSTTITEK